MKAKDIQGILHIDKVRKSEQELVFNWGGADVWDNTDDWQGFRKRMESAQYTEKVCLTKAVLTCWNRNKGREVTFAQEPENLAAGKLVVGNWKEELSIFWRSPKRMDIYWILQGESEGRSVCYILGGEGDCSEFFCRSEKLRRLREDELKLFMVQRFIDEKLWLFRIVSRKTFLDYLVETGDVQRVYLDVEGFDWVDGKLQIRLAPTQREAIRRKKPGNCLLYNEKSGLMYRIRLEADDEKGLLTLGKDFRETLVGVFLENPASFLVKALPVVNEGEDCVYYELRSVKRIRKTSYYNCFRRYGEFMDIGETEEHTIVTAPYYTPAGYLNFVVQKKYYVFTTICEAHVKDFRIQGETLRIRFTLADAGYELKSVSLRLRNGLEEKKYDFHLSVQQKKGKIAVEGTLDLSEVQWEQFYWDIRGLVTRDGQDYELRLRNHSKFFKLKMLLRDQQHRLGDSGYLVATYLAKSYDMAVVYRMTTPQDCRQFVYREYLALFLYYLLRPYWLHKNIWLVYEKYSITAQDNSLYFFTYCMEQLPEEERKHIFYVIDKSANDYQYVKQYDDRVIQFLSLRHMIYLKAAHLLISSDTKAHAYAWHSPNSLYRERMKNNRNVFLQHGVIYYKKCHQGLKRSGTNSCSLFIVSSEVEKEIVQQYFGYNDTNIAVTGLARWDVLTDRSLPGEKMILMMPTWRNWLEEVTEEEFRRSEYCKNYTALLNSPRLHSFLERTGTKLVFYIHPKFREYISAFAMDSPWIETIEFGTQPLNALLMRCNMMVTDYSSACWDVFYQGKPVLFYLFDFELYDQMQGSYVDMRTEAFGDTADQIEELVQLMEEYEKNGFQEKEKYAGMRETLLPFRDHRNSERIYQAIRQKFYGS